MIVFGLVVGWFGGFEKLIRIRVEVGVVVVVGREGMWGFEWVWDEELGGNLDFCCYIEVIFCFGYVR